MNREELLELIPAYALDALDNDERIEVENLLAQDSEAQSLLSEYEAVAAVLPLAVSQRPAPSHLRAGLKARLAKHQATSEAIAPETETATSVSEKSDSRTLTFPMTSILVAAAAIIVLVVGLLFVLLSDNSKPENPNEVLFNQLIEQEGSERFTITPALAEDVTGELVISADASQAILRIAALPDVTEQESYQLWLITDDTVQSGGIFHWATGHGPYYVPIRQSIEELVAVGMTIEPFDGSPLVDAPTGERLFAVEIASNQ